MTKGKKILAAVAAPLVLGGFLVATQPGSSLAAAGTPVQSTQTTYGPGLGLGLGRAQGGMLGILSKILGLDLADLRAERQAGKSIAGIAAEHGISKDQLVDTITAERQKLLDEKVAAGQITPEQASYCLENMKERIGQNLERTTVGPNGQGRGGWKAGAPGNSGARQGMQAGPRGRAGQGAGFGRGQASSQQ
ncbi:hypothetical protein MGLY_24920 [Neomoorella glycerini]|uniref:DUF2680 domain-containing protein n=1 Tax=Neomoorella glycerini TaxID=55779 RepID=A0A6I5ZU01_9FIRM|nr:hypothetical protein [Moorella glycerini]QGP93095.1 hypothetical protein MGLY_24920 [Moorella glycerini]